MRALRLTLPAAAWMFSVWPGAVSGADVSFYLVAKGLEFNQSSGALPVPKTKSYRFHAAVEPAPAGVVSQASVQASVQALPSGALQVLVAQGGSYQFTAKFTTQGELDLSAPDGSFQLVIHAAHDGAHTSTLALEGASYPASVPHLSNFDAAQAIDPSTPFTLTWDRFNGGRTNDFIWVTITDSVGNPVYISPGLGLPGQLDGTATSVTIPANVLPPDTGAAPLNGQLDFARVVAEDITSYPGATGGAVYYGSTQFPLNTTRPVSAVDVKSGSITKQETFDQDLPGVPVLDTTTPFRFLAIVTPATSNSVVGATVQLPGQIGHDLTYQASQDRFLYVKDFLAQNSLDANYPGNVAFTLTTRGVHDGLRTGSLSFPANDNFPTAPHISQLLPVPSPNAGYDIIWDPFTGGTSNDDILVSVTDSGGNTVVSVTLEASATHYVLPAGIPQAGQTDQIMLNFRRFAVRGAVLYPGAQGSVVFSSRTLLNFGSSVTLPAPPRLVVVSGAPAGQFELRLMGLSGQTYVIEGSSSLGPGSWLPLTTNSGVFTFIDNSSPPARFYRGRTAP